MRVKRKKSKRVSTRMREGIKKKVAAHRRKERKLEKKNPTWKSRRPKDIGIPSSFPYKDRILLEIEEKKREKEEELERKREEKRSRRAQMAGNGETVNDEDIEEEVKQDSMAALMESAQKAADEFEMNGKEGNTVQDDDKMDEDAEGFEVIDYEIEDNGDLKGNRRTVDQSRKQFDKVFKNVLDAADVVLYVLDSRNPEATRSRKVEEAILNNQDKRLIFVLNKVDLVPEPVLKNWIQYLQKFFPTVPVKGSTGTNGSGAFNKKLTQASTSGQLLEALKLYAERANLKRSITVGVIGFPNVGKSSVINSLTTRRGRSGKLCPVGNEAGITRNIREIKMDNKLKILDSPGIVFPEKGDSSKSMGEFESELVLLNALPKKEIKDPERAVKLLIKRLSNDSEMADSFKNYYNLPALPALSLLDFVKQVLIYIARSHGRLGKGGIPNLSSAAVVVLNDWRDGKFHGWNIPPLTETTTEENNEVSKSVLNTERKEVVSQWSKEFDLDGLFADVFN
ncbi:hypothetical protein HII12_005245 [Brettanomyces bruxellensis]|uniref:CP-type G domain-containing protein n=1 Tax=Dekkera bruxellensis TaxID=5007 RepID=A0A8H6EQ78_DEKBR|nr:hypothetical protein HII12_005245 [Brettanomyces bruxellensis]